MPDRRQQLVAYGYYCDEQVLRKTMQRKYNKDTVAAKLQKKRKENENLKEKIQVQKGRH